MLYLITTSKRSRTLFALKWQKRETAKDKLLAYVDIYDNFMSLPFPDGGCPIINTASESDDTHPGLKKKATNAINNWKNKITQLLEKGIQAKEFNKNINVEKIALTMIASIEGSSYDNKTHR